MSNWFNKHLNPGLPEPVREQPFEPIPPKELSVYDEQHPRPKDEVGADGVKSYLTEQARATLQTLEPKSAKSLASPRSVVGAALQVVVTCTMPPAEAVEAKE